MRRAKVLAPTGTLEAWCVLAAMSALLAACAPLVQGQGANLGAPQASPGGRAERTAPASISAEVAVAHAKTTLAAAATTSPRLVAASLPAAGAALGGVPGALALERLKGLSARELSAALGNPTLLRRDGPAQIWQYAGNGCVLHVFLYQDQDTFRVSYSEMRIDDPAADLAPTCAEWKGKPPARAGEMPGADARMPGASPLMSVASIGSSID